MKVSAPQRVLIKDHAAFLWTLLIDSVPYQVVWWLPDGTLRASWLVNDEDWSPFVRLGSRWSPRYDLVSAQTSMKLWAIRQEQRLVKK